MIGNKKYDLEERTALFGERVIKYCRGIKLEEITRPLINQLVRSATSVDANYLEANGASSKKDFKNKVFICKKEAQESRYWCRMLSVAINQENKDLNEILQESKELSMIFHAIILKC